MAVPAAGRDREAFTDPDSLSFAAPMADDVLRPQRAHARHDDSVDDVPVLVERRGRPCTPSHQPRLIAELSPLTGEEPDAILSRFLE